MIHTPEEAGFQGRAKIVTNPGQTVIFKHSPLTHPHEAIRRGMVFRSEFIWYHPEDGNKELYWVNSMGEMYKLVFIRSLPDQDWLNMINSEKKKQEFIDMVFDYVDNGGDREDVKRKIKELLN